MDKPELGIKPYFVAYDERIKELSDAIYRNHDTKQISKYAFEIIKLCQLIDDIRNSNEDLNIND